MINNGQSKKRIECPICGHKKHVVIYRSTYKKKNHLNTAVFSARRVPDRVHGTIVRCHHCGLVRTLEIIDPSNLSKLYAESSFTYDSLVDNLTKSYGDIIKDAIGRLKSKDSFLEIGCGNGFMLAEAIRIGFRRVYGIEPSHDAITKASRGIKARIKQGLLRSKIFPKDKFDLIAAFQVFDHIPDPNEFLRICRGLLRKDGLLVLMNHDVESLSARILGEKSPIFDIEHTYLYSQHTIQEILKKNNFSIVKVFNPHAIFSIRYFLRLLPVPNRFKNLLGRLKWGLLDQNIKIHPGNLAVFARKIK